MSEPPRRLRHATAPSTTDRRTEREPTPRPLSRRLGAPFEGAGLGAPVRRFECTHYDLCLDRAVDQAWPSWSCEGCDAFLEAPVERQVGDVAGLLLLWTEATGESILDGPGGLGRRPRSPARAPGRPPTRWVPR